MAELRYVEKESIAVIGDVEKAWTEVSFGHYEKGDTKYGDKIYLIKKYMQKGEERTDKTFALDVETAKEICSALTKYFKEK